MTDVVLLVDLFSDFAHEDGERLLGSLRIRREGIIGVLDQARRSGAPIVFVDDRAGRWDSDARRVVADALAGLGGDVLGELAPQEGDRFLLKPRYSAFDHTPLSLLLEELGCDRVVIAGMSTEGCVAQSAIDARELGYKVSVVADACATIEEPLEAIALRYLAEVVGVRLIEADEIGGASHAKGRSERD